MIELLFVIVLSVILYVKTGSVFQLWVFFVPLILWLILRRLFKKQDHPNNKRLLIIGIPALLLLALMPSEPHSCSMYHAEPFDAWWVAYGSEYPNITKEQFAQFPFPNGLQIGDAIHIPGLSYKVGDVVVAWNGQIIAHRFLGTELQNGKVVYRIKGDFNRFEDAPATFVIGKVIPNPLVFLSTFYLRPEPCVWQTDIRTKALTHIMSP